MKKRNIHKLLSFIVIATSFIGGIIALPAQSTKQTK